MNTQPFTSGLSENALMITRVADRQWHALDDDLVVGRGHAQHRPDGRLFVSIDAWHDVIFDRLAEVMLAELPAPLYTVVDEADVELTAGWRRAGFTIRRREWEYVVPTDPRVTGLEAAMPPAGVTIVPAGQADERLLRAVDRAIRDEVEATVGWQSMPAEVIPRLEGDTIVDPSKYAVAAVADRYLGLIRVVTVKRPRIGLVAVRSDEQRRGIARALLAHALGTMHRSGVAAAWTEVQESNHAASALFGGIGARPMSSNLELAR
ncbi:GNAT family N-acetyltransferase [Streptomyces canus]|uniref:Ribosomal protein S18 acetylase RimI-like enzyme n=1 Tax=Streptomyces canus TaxID=58343 RepID=A0AAW8F5G4_9ACTN|nr:GNAT family N-acetyltransferase [Streptomyces canus]MDQ0766644.1 ribosomal protein S18 acetylase RimI-like enzyme [Streptomyces canus]MDQ0905326.1 ribosomal protein S18 acetylase RimI-like enzyme [Streptomyces canus]MDQ1073550.1 ribosomal protein S18 acetylase RimI-like enzyme [Streptomyces canus]